MSDLSEDSERYLAADPDLVRCPFGLFERLRDEAPVHHVESAGVWLVTRYADICEVVRDPETFSSLMATGPHGGRMRETLAALAEESAEVRGFLESAGFRDKSPVLLRCDPPRHTQQRKLVNKAFTPRRVRQIEDGVAGICDRLIDDVIDRTDGSTGRMDLVADFAVPLPITVIAGALGVSDGDLPTFKQWSDDLAASIGNDDLSRDQVYDMVRSQSAFAEYFDRKITDRRANRRDDLISDVVHATIDGDSLHPDEMLTMFVQFLVAGNETTTTHIASTMRLLLADPELMARCRADLSLVPALIEESLRVESPILGLYRTATRDTEVGGVPVPAGAHLLMCYAAGNRDGAQFERPDTIDLERSGGGGHLAFGQGPHFCLGSALARAESRIGLTTLLTRLRDIRTDPDAPPLDYGTSYILRGPKRLDLLFEKA
ncbi:MAG TPA: cytochrome P450 [Pseudonocardia sp.]|nr:cytochrome P450 [Pseudonocardia sp.]